MHDRLGATVLRNQSVRALAPSPEDTRMTEQSGKHTFTGAGAGKRIEHLQVQAHKNKQEYN